MYLSDILAPTLEKRAANHVSDFRDRKDVATSVHL